MRTRHTQSKQTYDRGNDPTADYSKRPHTVRVHTFLLGKASRSNWPPLTAPVRKFNVGKSNETTTPPDPQGCAEMAVTQSVTRLFASLANDLAPNRPGDAVPPTMA